MDIPNALAMYEQLKKSETTVQLYYLPAEDIEKVVEQYCAISKKSANSSRNNEISSAGYIYTRGTDLSSCKLFLQERHTVHMPKQAIPV